MEIKSAQEILGTPFTKSAYDLFGQTKFDAENKYWELLDATEGISEEERSNLFWQSIRQKR